MTDLSELSWRVWCVESDSSDQVPVAARAVFEGFSATVPGCIHTDLMAAGLLADPYVGRNEAAQEWVGEQTWSYGCSLVLASDAPELTQEHAELVFEGLDTVALMVVNGAEVGRTFNQHRTYRFDVTHLLSVGENRIEVTFLPARAYGWEQDRLLGHRPDSYQIHPYNAVRKMACNFGWDWGPTLITCGIWRAARLESWDRARIGSAAVLSGLDTDLTTGRLTVRLGLDGDVAGARVVVEVAGQRAEVAAAAECSVELAAPGIEPWWPHSMGEPRLHDATVTLVVGDKVLDRIERRVGFRTAALDTTPDLDGGGARFALVINGEEVFVRGANWIPDDCFPSRVTRARYAERVGQAVDANLDLLRVWGGGTYESHDFYDACDEAGVLVWQDFTLACAAYAEEEPLRSEFEAEARDNVVRLSHHPSLVIWNGGNENLEGFDDWGWQAELKGATWGAGYYYDLFPSIVAELDGTRPYWPGSPGSGNLAIHANNANYGTIHIWDVWNSADYTHYSRYSPRFAAEFGFQGPATYATWARAVEPAERWPGSPTMLSHQKATGGSQKLLNGLVEHLPASGTGVEDFDDWLYLTQLNQARALRYALEWFRSMRGRCMGTVIWQLNDCWPVSSWSALDSGLDASGQQVARRKPLWYALRSAYADRLLTIQPTSDGGWQAIAVNDGVDAWASSLTCSVRRLDGSVVEQVTVPTEVGTRSRTALTLPFAVRQGQQVIVVAEADGAERAVRPLAEDSDLALPEAAYHATVTRNGNNTTVRVMASTFCRSLCLFVDRVAENLHADTMLVDLFPSESHDFVIEGDLSGVTDSDLVSTLRCSRSD